MKVENVVLPVDGGASRQLTAGDEVDVSPDGSHVAYVDHRSLIVARSDGSDPRQVFHGFVWNLTWSPSGDRVAFVTHVLQGDATNRYFAELRVVDVATGTASLLSEAERGTSLGVSVIEFSPQGDRILFSKSEDRGSGEPGGLWSIGVDGSDVRLVVAGTNEGEWLSR